MTFSLQDWFSLVKPDFNLVEVLSITGVKWGFQWMMLSLVAFGWLFFLWNPLESSCGNMGNTCCTDILIRMKTSLGVTYLVALPLLRTSPQSGLFPPKEGCPLTKFHNHCNTRDLGRFLPLATSSRKMDWLPKNIRV